MIKTSLMQGILVACGLSVVSLPLMMVLAVLGVSMANQVLIAMLAGGYMAYLLANSPSPVGRATLGAIGFTGLAGACVWGASTVVVGLLAVGLIWLVRTLLHYSSVVSALVDGLLCTMSLGGALAALLLTGNVVLTVWCFFLPQALFVFSPRRLKRSPTGQASVSTGAKEQSRPDTFARAHRAAQAAIHCLAQQTAG
jgi:hypothetical protein